jgi:uncharacterized membrane protein
MSGAASAGLVVTVLAAFIASAVEMVEALTIVLAVGITREWRSTVIGTLTAAAALAVVCAALGPALTLIPISVLRLIVGALLLVFGLQWLRKAILRGSGFKALHDEDDIFRREVEEAREAGAIERAGMDWYAFTISFKGVFLEGLEVAFIVITFGSARGRFVPVAAAAGVAFVVVAVTGALVHRPLSRVPENTMKFSVGVMLTTFGIFWGAEGTGIAWPGGEIVLVAVLAFVLAMSLSLVGVLRRRHERLAGAPVTEPA